MRRLNAIRGLAALIVVVSHYSNASGLWAGRLGSGAGQLGVMLFFLLSAFLMAYLYLPQTCTASAMRRYAVARMARVLPLFLAVVLACFAIRSFPHGPLFDLVYPIDGGASLAAHLLLLQGMQVLWTIPAEIHFYVLFAALWWLRDISRWAMYAVVVTILVMYCAGGWPATPSYEAQGVQVSGYIVQALPSFMSGLLLGMAFHRWQVPARFRSHAWALVLVLLPLLFPMIFTAWSGHTHSTWDTPGILIALSLIFAAVVFLVPEGNVVLENRIGDSLGAWSYSWYLLHLPVLLLLQRYGLAVGWGGLAIFLVASLAVAYASYRFFELPTRRYLRARFLSPRQLPLTQT